METELSPGNVFRYGRFRYRIVRDKVNYLLGSKRRCVSSAPHPVGLEFRHVGSKKPVTMGVTGFLDAVVPPAGCPRAAGAARFRCVASLLACCAGKRSRVSSAPYPVGFESRHIGNKKPATELVTGFSDSVVPPAGFEPAISTLKGWRPWPLDDGDSGKEYSRLFCRRVYRWQTGKPPHRSWPSPPDLQKSQSITSGRVNRPYLLQIETKCRRRGERLNV